MKQAKQIKNCLPSLALGILIFSIFILTYNIRWQLLFPIGQRTYLWSINYLAYFSLVLFICTKCISFTRTNIVFFCIPIFSIVFPFFTLYSQGVSLGFFVMLCFCCIFSIYFIFIEFPSENRSSMLKKCLMLLNILACIMLIWGVIDRMCDQIILRQIAKFMTHIEYYTLFAYPTYADHRRFYSFLGQPLTNTLFFNFIYVINLVYNEKHKPIVPSWLCCILMIPALAACGSKAGLIIYIVITLIMFFHNVKVLLLFGISAIIVIASGLMNNLIDRLLHQPLTTGRYTSLMQLLSDPNYPFMLFQGYGQNSNATPYGLAAVELVPVNFAFSYGILFACLILGTTFIYVTMKLCRKGSVRTWILWCLLFAEANSYADMTITWDTSLMVYVLTMIILNLAIENPNSNNKIPTVSSFENVSE